MLKLHADLYSAFAKVSKTKHLTWSTVPELDSFCHNHVISDVRSFVWTHNHVTASYSDFTIAQAPCAGFECHALR